MTLELLEKLGAKKLASFIYHYAPEAIKQEILIELGLLFSRLEEQESKSDVNPTIAYGDFED